MLSGLYGTSHGPCLHLLKRDLNPYQPFQSEGPVLVLSFEKVIVAMTANLGFLGFHIFTTAIDRLNQEIESHFLTNDNHEGQVGRPF